MDVRPATAEAVSVLADRFGPAAHATLGEILGVREQRPDIRGTAQQPPGAPAGEDVGDVADARPGMDARDDRLERVFIHRRAGIQW